jgi:hypothetical protein
MNHIQFLKSSNVKAQSSKLYFDIWILDFGFFVTLAFGF